MAPDLKNESYFTFDKNAQPERFRSDAQDRPSLRVYKALSSRYAVLAIVFILAGALIFYNTAALQLNASSVAGIAESSGISRQMTVHAPRGDILDINGIPLAYSRPVSVLYLTYAGLEDQDLNHMLLDLADLLNQRDIAWSSKLTTYFDWSHEACDHEPVTDLSDLNSLTCGEPVFKKDQRAIEFWHGAKFRLHERWLYARDEVGRWSKRMLYP